MKELRFAVHTYMHTYINVDISNIISVDYTLQVKLINEF